MSFPTTILPSYTPKSIADQGPLLAFKDRVLQELLLTSFLLGIPACLLALPPALRAHNWGLVVLPILMMVATGILTVERRLPFTTRAVLYLSALFLLDIHVLLRSGYSSTLFVLLYGTVFYTGLFFGWRGLGIMTLANIAGTQAIRLVPGHSQAFNGIFAAAASTPLGTALSYAVMLVITLSIIVTGLTLVQYFSKSLKNEASVRDGLERERGSVETRLHEQTELFQRRKLQYTLAAEISQAISSVLDPDELLQMVADLMLDRFKLYYIGVFVLDSNRRYAVLKAGTGEAGRKMLAEGHSLSVGGASMIGWTTLNRQARVALDVGSEAVRFNNPHLPYTRSEIALPILAKGEVLGAITAQSTQPNAFDDEDMTILQGVANSLGVALDNARLYQQTENALEEVRMMNKDYVNRTWIDTARQRGNINVTYESPQSQTGTANAREFPILLRDQVIGYVTLESDRDELSEDETAFIDAVTSQTAVALENARLLEETQRHAAEEQTLNAMTEKFSQAVSVDDVLESALKELSELPSVAEVSIHLISPGMTQGNNGHNGHNGNGNGNGK